MSDSETASLARRAIQGDVGAFEILLRRYFRVAFATALSIVGHRTDAEDVCQDAFVAAFEQLGTCRDPARFPAWLLQIVRNRARNVRERERVRRTEPLDASIPRGGTVDAAVRADARLGLQQAFRHLTDVQTSVVLLHDLEGWKHREIAAHLGLSELMSRRHLSDARQILRRHLAHHDPRSVRECR